MVKHVVIFKFSGTTSERNALAETFREALVRLPYVIPELKSIEVGINENPAEKWDLCLTACADSIEDIAIYSASSGSSGCCGNNPRSPRRQGLRGLHGVTRRIHFIP